MWIIHRRWHFSLAATFFGSAPTFPARRLLFLVRRLLLLTRLLLGFPGSSATFPDLAHFSNSISSVVDFFRLSVDVYRLNFFWISGDFSSLDDDLYWFSTDATRWLFLAWCQFSWLGGDLSYRYLFPARLTIRKSGPWNQKSSRRAIKSRRRARKLSLK